MITSRRSRVAAVLLVVPALAACSDLFKVSNPGPIPSSSLGTSAAAAGIVTGISAELSTGIGRTYLEGAVVAREIFFANSNNAYDNGGTVTPDDDDGTWSDAQTARWVAEHGVLRLQSALGSDYNKNPLAARANLLAGFANRMIGENFCQTVIDGGPAQDRTVSFQRAEAYFTEALAIESAAGDNSYATAAYGGRASVEAWLGESAKAAADAQQVPIDYEYDAIYNTANNLLNTFGANTWDAQEISVYGSLFQADSLDPRTPSTLTGGQSQDGKTPFQAQEKYLSDSSYLPLTKGTEMLTLRAELALGGGDITTEMQLLNQVRAFYGIAPLATPADVGTAWADLRFERGHTLWLEGRRYWDLQRWFAATGSAHDTTLTNRAKCLPIGRTELQTNPNLHGH
ncbi:MAG TPA: RagB/SusD family nutrient uptake outer membrane protein [Gemmatimonadaceae bacterium]|nr:RagB/SusD family nutrient uptake outer membrane protein [Gemmatimonadaceae bacterium]